EFSAPSFTARENVQFRYQLQGFDEDWVEAGTQRTAEYSRLPAADYHFRVGACSSGGAWNESGATLTLQVTPFFWQRWTFRAAALGAFTLLVAATVRYVSFRRVRLHL